MSRLALVRHLLDLFSRREKWLLAGLVVLMSIGAGLELLGIGAIVPFIGVLGTPGIIEQNKWLRLVRDAAGIGSTRDFLLLLGVLMLGVFVLKNCYLALLSYAQSKFVLAKQTMLAKQLFDAYMRNPYTFHLQNNSAVLLYNINGEVPRLVDGVVMPSLVLLNELLLFAFVIVLLIAVEPYVALGALTVIGALGLISQSLVKPMLGRYGRNRAREGGEMSKWVNQGLSGVKEAKVMGREGYFVDAHHLSSLKYARFSLFFSVMITVPRLVIETLAVAGILVVALILLLRDSDLADALPVLTLFAVAAIRLMPSAARIFASVSSIRFFYPAVGAVTRGLAVTEQSGAGRSIARAARVPRPGRVALREQISIDGVWFRYPGHEDWALRDVSFAIRRGASVALVGHSGAGKSTLVDILLGLLHPERGAVRVDGADLFGILPAWQGTIGYVPQSIYLLDDTVRRNVAFGIADDDIDDAKVWNALRLANVEEKVRNLPLVLDSLVGERGIRLSGGERQRIGIARALYHDPDVIIFDEATSNLDATTEQTISHALKVLAGSKTVIIIAHRLSTVRHCEQLILMKNGAILATGGFEVLVASSAEFADLVRTQMLLGSVI